MQKNLWFITALLVIATAVIGCTAQTVGGVETTLESVYTRVNPSVVLIQGALLASTSNAGSQALGSGFVWDTKGDIVTDQNVINGAYNLTVAFSDGTVVDASLIGTDADYDLAVIKVDPSGLQLHPVTLAHSNTVKVGQLAVAIGNPFGDENTMTVGFVSALVQAASTITGQTYYIPGVIQIATPVNPDNSGGVLLDSTGAVIGVTQTSFSGVTEALPSSIIKQIVPGLIKNGYYDHPYLGVIATSLDPQIATAMNLPSKQLGALVEAVSSGGPADKGGVKAGSTSFTDNGAQITIGGDVIIAYNGQPVKSFDDLNSFIVNTGSVGQNVALTVLRSGKQIKLQITMGIRPGS